MTRRLGAVLFGLSADAAPPTAGVRGTGTVV